MDGVAGCWWASEFGLQGLQSGGHIFRLGPNQHSPCKQCPWLATKTALMLSITSGRLGFVQLWQRCWCLEEPCVCERPRVPETDIFLQVLQGHQSWVFLIACFMLIQHTKHTKTWSIALNKTSSYSRTTAPGYQAMEIAQTQATLFGRCQALQSTESAGL